MRGLSGVLLLMSCCASHALGQEAHSPTYPGIEYFTGYSAIETNDHIFQFRDIGPVGQLDFDEKGSGFEAAVIRNLSRYLGIMGDFSAHLSLNRFSVPLTTPCSQALCSSTQEGTINPRLFYFLAGPEIKWRNRTRITPTAHALFGIAHSTATFSTAGSVLNLSRTDAETGFALALGAGFDLRISRRVSLRELLTHSQAFVGSNALPSQRVNSIGWSAGVLFH
jgi:hypothetical protein